jgi:hypothetical protein
VELLRPGRRLSGPGHAFSALTSPVADDEHRVIAQLLGLTVRVIEPNGLMKTFGAGPVCTLLYVREPAARYRFAQ